MMTRHTCSGTMICAASRSMCGGVIKKHGPIPPSPHTHAPRGTLCTHLLDMRQRQDFGPGIDITDGARDAQPPRPDAQWAHTGLLRLGWTLQMEAELSQVAARDGDT